MFFDRIESLTNLINGVSITNDYCLGVGAQLALKDRREIDHRHYFDSIVCVSTPSPAGCRCLVFNDIRRPPATFDFSGIVR